MSSPAPYSADFAPEETTVSDRRKIDPQNIEAEKSVLAACMLNQEAIEEVAPKLVKENFYRIAHQRIYESMMDLYVRHIPIDHISLADNLKAMGQLEAVGGKAYLIELADNTFALTNWQNHLEIVKRTSILRDLIRASGEIEALAYDAPDDLGVVVEEAEKTLFHVTEKRVSSAFKRMDVLLTEAFEELTKLAEQKDAMAGIPSGFKDVDDLFHGFRGGDLVILAARPGVGKTSFALNLALNAAADGYTVGFFSLEMSGKEIAQRFICAQAMVSMSNFRTGRISPQDWANINEATKELSRLDILIDDTPGTTVTEIRAKSRRMLHNKEKAVIVLDYLQLVNPPAGKNYNGNRAVEVSEMSRGLKIMAKELGVPVIMLSQLNRSLEGRTGKRPQMSDLRESGSIEQDADIILLLDRSTTEEEAARDDRPGEGVTRVIVAKNRSGPIGDVDLMFLPASTKFYELDEHAME